MEGWTAAHHQTLQKIVRMLETSSLPPVLLVRVAESLSWQAYHGPLETRPLALRVIALLDRDLETRLVRGLMDG